MQIFFTLLSGMSFFFHEFPEAVSKNNILIAFLMKWCGDIDVHDVSWAKGVHHQKLQHQALEQIHEDPPVLVDQRHVTLQGQVWRIDVWQDVVQEVAIGSSWLRIQEIFAVDRTLRGFIAACLWLPDVPAFLIEEFSQETLKLHQSLHTCMEWKASGGEILQCLKVF